MVPLIQIRRRDQDNIWHKYRRYNDALTQRGLSIIEWRPSRLNASDASVAEQLRPIGNEALPIPPVGGPARGESTRVAVS